MLGKKIILNDRIRKLITDYRKSAKDSDADFTADKISEKIGRTKSWLSQVENGRLKSVKTADLVNVFCLLQNRDKDDESDRKIIEEFLDEQILYITITEKHGIFDPKGNIIDFSEMLSFKNARDHINYAGKNLKEIFIDLIALPIEDIQSKLKSYIDHVFNDVVYWYNRAFNDTAELFSDEISTINLYLLIKTCVDIHERHYEYFGLNPLQITGDDLSALREKLNTNFFVKGRTVIKSLNDYSYKEIDEVISHFSTEEYMQWMNKRIYSGHDPFPMLIDFSTTPYEAKKLVHYDDVSTATGLSEKEYLHIIKQLYFQADVMYNKCKVLLKDLEECRNENDELFSELQKYQSNNS